MPIEIVGLGQKELELHWSESQKQTISAADLRRNCRCALCVSEITGKRTLDPESISDDTSIQSMELVGNYGLSVHFSDGHQTSIYHFKRLLDWPSSQ